MEPSRDPVESESGTSAGGRASLPPRWVVRSAWAGHRALLRVTGDRVGLTAPTPGGRFGMLRLHTTGRRSGRERAAILGYVEDGPRVVALAMNGWAPQEPAWWLNLQEHPDARVDLVGGEAARVRAREATGAERERLWQLVSAYDGYGDVAALAQARGRRTAVVVFDRIA